MFVNRSRWLRSLIGKTDQTGPIDRKDFFFSRKFETSAALNAAKRVGAGAGVRPDTRPA
jgi:hypothetical protein